MPEQIACDDFPGKPLVSVVVPVYNVQDYLDRCVESLVTQTLEDIEIILVDDGSTDSSPSLCDAWADRDCRIRVHHKDNGGLSDARNTGAELARADWVGFVDSDDYVEPEMYQALFEGVMRERADIAICGTNSVYFDYVDAPKSTERYVLTGYDALRETLVGDKLRVWIPPRLYARRILLDAPMPVGHTYEDAYMLADFFTRAERVAIDLRPQYNYWHHEGTITSRPFSHKSMDIVYAFEHTYEVVMRECPQLRSEAEFRVYWSRFEALDKMLVTRGIGVCEEQDGVVSYLRAHFKGILQNPYIGHGRKLAMCALYVSVRMYAVFARVHARTYRVKKA